DRAGKLRHRVQAVLPFAHFTLDQCAILHVSLEAAPCRTLERAHHIGGTQLVAQFLVVLDVHAPSSLVMHNRKRSSPRRIQVLIVPSGCFNWSATSLCDKSW